MAEYNEVIKQFKRMCKSISPAKCTRGECPMGCENIGQCRKIAFEKPAHFAATVMHWAEEHPEPVYPTWEQVIAEMFLRYGRDNPRYHNIAEWEIKDRIPADIAQKLGIEPKAGGDT